MLVIDEAHHFVMDETSDVVIDLCGKASIIDYYGLGDISIT